MANGATLSAADKPPNGTSKADRKTNKQQQVSNRPAYGRAVAAQHP